MTSFFSLTRALAARKRKIFALFFALAASIGLSWAQNPSGECGGDLTWEFEEATGKLTISGTGTMLNDPSWRHEDLNSRIKSVSLPEGLTDIGPYSFAECENLESITLPSGLTSIDTRAFTGCRALREITLPGSLTTLGEQAFFYCRQLESIKLPEGITTLENDVFAHCNSLRSVTLPPTLTSIGEGVFKECGQLESITLPDGLTSIGNNAFSGCHYLESITLPSGLTSIGNNAFEYCGFESIKLPEGITTLGTGVFSNCDRLQSVTLPPSLTSIGNWAFNGCGQLRSVTLPESVTSIGANAFFGCGLTSMTLPAGVTTIGESAFAYCYSLTEFTNKAATPQAISANVFEEVTLSNITLNVPGTSKAAYEAADVWKDFGTKAAIPGTEPATPKAYSSGTVALKDLIVGDTLMAGVTLTDDAGKAVFFVENRYAVNGSTKSIGGLFNQFISMLTSPLLGDNASFSLPGMTVTPINEEGNAGYAWVVVEGDTEFADVYLAGIGTQSGSSDEGPAGALKGKFSVADDKVVCFSKGNLQYNSNTQAWQFAGNQYDFVGDAAGNTSVTADGIADNNGIVDLFCWVGASSTWTGLKQYGITTLDYDGLGTADGYGDNESEALKSDWGTTMGEGWFTLSIEQWMYLFYTRTDDKAATVNSVADCRYTKATINTDGTAVMGIILFPDGGTFAASEFTEVGSPNTKDETYTTTCTTAQWNALQTKGCVFLPAAGYRDGTSVSYAGSRGYYWSSSANDVSYAGNVYFNSGSVLPANSDFRNYGNSVRLVYEVPAPSVTLPKAVEGLVYTGAAQTLIAAGEAAGYTFQYKVGENGEYSADLPTATDAGSYTVYYKATNGNEEQDITGSVDATIAKADINLGGSEGALTGKFSVADGKAIYFSQGNLQYNSNTQAWQFAGNQYHFVGDAAGNTSVIDDGIADNNGTVDLFGWVGASSTWTGLKQYGITALDDAAMNVTDGCGNNASEALKSDWGTTMGEGWFTLSKEQWTYLFNTRTGDKAATVNSVADCRYTKATINTDGTAVRGIILFPDGGTFAASEFTEVGSPNAANADYSTTCTTAQWNALQTKGCVFLPAAGNRVGTSMTAAGWGGFYWSSSPDPFDMSSAYCAYFYSDNVNPARNDFRFYGYSVRLVTETAPASVTLPKAVAGLTANGEAKTLITAGECEDGTLYYSLDKENWSATLPTGTEAQDYTVYYYVKGDANHNDSEVNSLTASIGTLPQALLGLVYTGEAQTLITAGEVAGFTYQYKVGDAEYSTDLPKATDAGSYTVYYKATAAGEQDITGSLEVSIAKADINLGGSEGVLKGKFSVAGDKVVYFSKGNLQFTSTSTSAAWSTGKFSFMDHQYDYIETTANPYCTDDYADKTAIGLFGWATSNINTPANTYYYPWETDKTNASYGSGITSGNVNWSDNINEFANYDWGANTGDLGTGWRTLTKDEWVYLFNTRTVNGGTGKGNSYTVGQSVNGTLGVVLYPDNYTGAVYTTGSDWSTFEDAGCVFLPAAGFRVGTSVSGVGSYGRYWSSTSNSGTDAYSVNFDGSSVLPACNSSRGYGFSVRLVTETAPAPASSVTLPQAVEELVYTSEEQALISAGECADGTFLYSTDNTNWVDTLPKVTDAGTYQVYYKIQGDANHNDYIAAEPLEVSIAKAALTITAENKEVVYGSAAPGFSVSYYGLKGGDLPADVLTGELSYACDYTAGSNVASYDIVPSGQTSANYDITYVKGTLNVLKADPAFTEPVANTLTYNGGAQTLIAAGTTEHGTFEYTFTPNDEESWNTALPQAKNADTYGVYYRVVGDANHLDYESADAVVVTIAKAALTATADDKSVIYGDDAPEYTVTYEGWQGEDNADVLSGTIAYACEYAPTSNVGDYTIVPSGVSNPDYAITFVNGKVTVSKAALTITADDKEVTYGDEAPAFTASYEGWKNEDDETVVSGLTLTSEYVLTSNVGEYAIVPADATAQNYAITFVNGTLMVNKAALMITAEDKEVTYGDEAPAFTASYEGWKNADDESVVSGLTLTSEYVLTSNVGEYDIVPADATAQNYAISYTNGTLTVNKAALMITADDKEVIYGDEHPAFTASYSGWKNADDESVVSGLTLTSEYVLTSNVGEYDIVPADAEAQNYAISYTNGTLTVNKAALMITADDKEVIYGDEAPAFTASYEGFKNEDDESVVSGLKYTCEYQPGSYIGAYSIEPNSATAQNYAITFVDGTLTVNRAAVIVSGAKVQIAKFEDGTTDAVVLDKGILNGVMLNDAVDHITTASFSDATVGEHKTIRVNYELTGDAALLANYDLILTAEDYIEEGIIIENFVPAEEGETEKEDEEAQIEEGIEVYAYGYCDGSGYSLRYHLNSGNPDQYKIDFDDPRFEDVDWTNLETPGKDGTIDINIPVDLPTGDYTFTATFRDSRFDWLPSKPLTVTFHVNLPETYVVALFDNVMAVVDTCECLTDIQWYWRANSTDQWQAIEGATGYYYKQEGGLTGEYFIKAKMNGVDTYTCPQDDMSLYGDTKQAKVSAYPNPVVNTTTVTIENSRLYEHKLRIVNLMGIEMMTTSFEGNTTSVEMGTFPQGHYMISVDGIVVKVMKK